MTRSRWIIAVAFVAAGACKGGESLPEAARLEAVAASTGQTGVAGGPLPEPLAVRVLSEDNLIVTRGRVRWSVTGGAGAVMSDTLTLSDGNGLAQVGMTLGPQPGNYTITATLADVEDHLVQLTASALPAPVLSAVAPTTFAGGDTVTVTGQDLADVDEVRIGGDLARVVTRSATQLTAVVPVCRAEGPVQVLAYRMRAPSNALQATFQSGGTVGLAPGQWTLIDPTRLPGCVTFPAAGAGGAEYLTAVLSATGTPGEFASFTFGGDSVAPPPPAPPVPAARTPAEVFHDRLRAWEAEAAGLPRPPMAAAATGPSIRRPAVGDTRSFRVCSIITCQEAEDFTPVTASARYVGDHAALYLDDNAPTGGFTSADLDSLGRLFDEELYEVATARFGSESDVDENGVVIVLLTPVVNGLTPSSICQTSVITGFFFGIDIDPRYTGLTQSNRGEIFYALSPDPNGTVSCSLSLETVRRLVPVTFIHEFQHMISYHQHVLLRNGTQESLWLNEGLSHLSEELAALHFNALGRSELFNRFALGDLFNGFLYLSETGSHFVLPSSGTGTLEERGAAWLFLRWLVDQHGEGITRQLLETSRTGAPNVEAVTGEPLDRLLADWFLATWVSDLPDFTPPARLAYSTWRLRTTYASLHDQVPSRFDRPYPIVPPVFNGGEFNVSGTLRSGSGTHYRIVQAADQAGFTLQLQVTGGGSVLPRVAVLRIR